MATRTSVTSHQDVLMELNERISNTENRGDRGWLAGILAPRLAFQRADDHKTIDDQVAFHQKVKPGGSHITRIIEPIELYEDRAIFIRNSSIRYIAGLRRKLGNEYAAPVQ